MTYDRLRDVLPSDLPCAVREALIGNVVVGNLSVTGALHVGVAIAERLRRLEREELAQALGAP
jgi:hypothetical protein